MPFSMDYHVSRFRHIVGSVWLIPITTFILTFAGFLFGERISVNDGLGWDGIYYVSIARNFADIIHPGGLSFYYIQRTLPCLLVKLGVLLTNLPDTPQSYIETFAALNVCCLVIASLFWLGIARELGLSLSAKWFGFTGLFLNYANLRFPFYYADAVDSTAFMLGTGMIWAYLARRPFVLAVLLILAFFTWVQAEYAGIILLLFPRDPEGKENAPKPNWLARPGALAICVLISLFIYYRIGGGPIAQDDRIEPALGLLPVSIAFCFAYIYFGFSKIGNNSQLFRLFRMSYLIKVLENPILWGTLVLLFSLHIVLSGLFPNTMAQITETSFLTVTLVSSASLPGITPVAHAIYYGPLFLCLVILWPKVCAEIHRHGIGLTIASGAGVFLSISTESRWVLNFLPLFVAFTAKVMDQYKWRASACAGFALLSIVMSKAWLPLNPGPTNPMRWSYGHFPFSFIGKTADWLRAFAHAPITQEGHGYFWSAGPWIPPSLYVLQGVIALILGFGFWVIFRKSNTSQLPEP